MNHRAALLKTRFGSDYFKRLGQRGAATTHTRHAGSEADWGRSGFEALVQSRFGGDREAAVKWLTSRGLASQDPFPQNGAFKDPGPMPTP